MADAPNQTPYNPYSPTSPEERADESASHRHSRLGVPEGPPSRTPSPTQYEFIMTTGDESATTARQKLKTVRSHVMKNYLQQQQRQGASRESLSVASSERRKGKQRARSSRSASREVEHSPTVSEKGHSASAEIGSLFSGFALTDPFASAGTEERSSLGAQQPFALDFGFNAARDEVSGFAQSYVTSLIRDKRAGLMEPSFETLNSKGETVRIVKDTLAVCGDDVPQSIVFAVSLLAFGCAIDCEWEQARGHLEALHRIVDARGGVQTVDFELQRTVTWTAYCLAGALHLPSQFPPPLFPSANAFPLAFLDDAQIRAWRTVKRFPKNNSFVFDVVVRLHQLGLATSSEWYNEVDQRALSNLYFEALQTVVSVELEEPWNANLPSGPSGHEAATMFRVWSAGLPLFVWATIRHVRTRLGLMVARSNQDPVLARIRDSLEGSGGYHSWPRGKSLEPVLATLFYGVECCEYTSPWRAWALDTMRKAVEMLKLKSSDEFKKVLEFFPGTPEYRAAADEVWQEMFSGSATVGTPSLTFSALQ